MAEPTVVIQAQDTAFERHGFSFQQKAYSLTSSIANLIASAYNGSAVSSTLSAAEQIMLFGLLSQNNQVLPGGLTLKNIQEINPALFEGAAALALIYNRDPFSVEYENNTREFYRRQFDYARAVAQSGPTNVRGGTARQALELSDLDVQISIARFREIWQNQVAVSQLVKEAVQIASAATTARMELQLQAQQQQAATESGQVQQSLEAAGRMTSLRNDNIRSLAAGAEFLGVPQMRVDDSFQGRGSQASVNSMFGATVWR